MIRETYVLLSEAALKHNYQLLRNLVPEDAFFCPMIKCDAYGHGAVAVARILEAMNCSQAGVVSVEEAMDLRSHGVKLETLIFGYISNGGWKVVEENGFIPVISSLRELKLLKESNIICRYHLKLNTGLNRLGIRLEELSEALKIIKSIDKSTLVGLCTHLVRSADIGQDGVSAHQVLNFEEALRSFSDLNLQTHVLNSTGLFRTADLDLKRLSLLGARPGLALYGVKLPEQGELALPLRPVMRFRSKVVQTQRVPKGETVSYEGAWRAERSSVVGTIPVGYGDGLPWALAGKGVLYVGSTKVPILGRICMDHIMVDLTDYPSLDTVFNEQVEIFGDRQEVTAVARQAGTIPYELLTRVSPRVPRVWERS